MNELEGYTPKTTPRIYQFEALRRGWDKDSFAYFMGRGTGKTKVTIDNAALLYMEGLIKGLLVIAPNSVHEKWVTEQIPIHMPDYIQTTPRVWENKNTKKYLKTLNDLFRPNYTLNILAMNVEAFVSKKAYNLAGHFLNEYPCMMVVDESTRIKSPGATRTKRLLKLSRYAVYKRILTGNEITKTPFESYSQMKFLNPHFWNEINYFTFKHTYAKFETGYAKIQKCKNSTQCTECGQWQRPDVKSFFNRKTDDWDVKFECSLCNEKITSANPKLTAEARTIKKLKGRREFPRLIGYQNLEELRAQIEPHCFRARKEDHLDIPEKIYDPIYVKMNKEQRRLYKELKEDLLASFEGELLDVKNKVSLFTRFRQITGGFFPTNEGEQLFIGSPKIDALLYDIEDEDPDTKIIIWASFTNEIRLITKTLRKTYPDSRTESYYGATLRRFRAQIISDFQNGDIRFLVANPEVGGTGLNLQASNLHYFYSQTPKAEDRWQAEDRSHRIGQHWPVVYRDILVKGTVDISLKNIVDGNKTLADFFASKTNLIGGIDGNL